MRSTSDKQDISYESRSITAINESFYPVTIEEAISILADYGKDARICAGATDLINLMRTQAIIPKYIIFINRITEIDYVRNDEQSGLKMGALTSLTTLQSSNEIRENYLLLHEAICQMGSVQIRNKATIGGNVCRAAPSADAASSLLALDANIIIAGPTKTRIIPIKDFFKGPAETDLKNDEILIEIQVPKLPTGTGTAFMKATRVAVDLAKVNVAVVLTIKNNVCENARISLGSVAPTPIRATNVEDMLKGRKLQDKLIGEIAEMVAHETKCISDLRAPADYRLELSKVLVRRALKIAMVRAVGI